MVVLLDLDDLEGDAIDTGHTLALRPRHLPLQKGDLEEDLPPSDARSNPNLNGFSTAVGCYP